MVPFRELQLFRINLLLYEESVPHCLKQLLPLLLTFVFSGSFLNLFYPTPLTFLSRVLPFTKYTSPEAPPSSGLRGYLSRGRLWVGWVWLEPAVSSTGQLQPLLMVAPAASVVSACEPAPGASSLT